MSDKKNKIDRDDEFSELFRKKLENHQIAVPDEVWAGIEKKLAQKPERKRRIAPYWIGAGVAAAIALLFLIKPIGEISQNNTQITQNKEQNTLGEPKPYESIEMPASNSVVSANEINPQSTSAGHVKSAGVFPQKNLNQKQYADIHADTDLARIADTESKTRGENEAVSPATTFDDSKDSNLVQGQSTENVADAQTNQKPENEIKKIDRLPDYNDYPEIPDSPKKTKKNQKVLMAAAFGTGGNLPESKNLNALPNEPKIPKRQLVNKEITENYAGILQANDYSNAVHQAPISFGVMVEKPFTDRLSIESGLVYTYLRSTYIRPGNVDYNGILQLHYLGIPLNLRVKAVKMSNWDIYASAGGMIEKGIRSYYHQSIENNAAISNTNVKSTVDGVQLSLNGAIGADYKLNQLLSLFIEPKVTYYLENNQPMSARTEQPLYLGVTGGVRIGL